MNYEEALEWMKGTRSLTNLVSMEPFETWQIRIAKADAAMMQQAYWVLRTHKEELLRREESKVNLEKNFTYHAPKDDQPQRYQEIRQKGKELAYTITALTPASREQSLALTNLEQAIFWANAAIARNE